MGNPLTDIGSLLVSTAFSLYILVVWLRFLLQQVRADFYNPISQFVVRATAPLLHPMRRAIPGLFGIDMAALVLIVLLKLVELTVLHLLAYHQTMPAPNLLFSTVFQLLFGLTTFYYWALLVMVVLSWVAGGGGYNPTLALLHQITEPLCAPMRRLLPATGGFDLSPILVFLSIKIVEILLQYAQGNIARVLF